jgi:hypothetical protein
LGARVSVDFFVLAGDTNRDRKVDLTDFTILAANFNKSLPSTATVTIRPTGMPGIVLSSAMPSPLLSTPVSPERLVDHVL